MSDDGRVTCPACRNSWGRIYRAFHNGEDCPSCGLPAHLAQGVIEFQERHSESELREQHDVAIARALTAEQRVRELEERMRKVREVATRPFLGGQP